MQIRQHARNVAGALFGETWLGFAGAALQWLALAILFAVVSMDRERSLTVSPLLPAFGVLALFAGLCLAQRGKTLGPVILLPGVAGILILVLLSVVLYPVRWFMPDESTPENRPRNER